MLNNKPGIGLMGGMFDPVHNGHLSTALSVLEEFGLDEVRIVPCGSPVHRPGAMASNEDRLAMLELATGEEPSLIVDDRECQAKGPSYTVSTLLSLREDYPESRLYLIVGIDTYNTLTTWHEWQGLFDLAHIIVITRPGWALDMNEELSRFVEKRQVSSFEEMRIHGSGKVMTYGFTPLMLGSTKIRALIKEKRSARYLLPDAVWKYINTHQLYT